MDTDVLAGLAGAALSLLFSYFPPIRRQYAALDGDGKRLVMGAAVLLVAAGIFTLACAGASGAPGLALPSCDRPGLLELAGLVLYTLLGNQGAFLLSPGRLRASAEGRGLSRQP